MMSNIKCCHSSINKQKLDHRIMIGSTVLYIYIKNKNQSTLSRHPLDPDIKFQSSHAIFSNLIIL